MFRYFALPALLALNVLAAPENLPQEFIDWAAAHGKTYRTDDDWTNAYKSFAANERFIQELREMDEAEYGHNIFGDLTPQQFNARFSSKPMDAQIGKLGGNSPEFLAEEDMPDAVDWRESGAVTPVKDQQSCGSCWAESAVGAVESAWYLANKETMKAPVTLSTEQVIECDSHDNACYGGFPSGAFQYIKEHGIASEADYPYNVEHHTICLANQTFNETCGDGMCDDPPLTNYCDLSCSAKGHQPVAHVTSWVALPTAEDQIAAYLFQHGPVSVCLDASGKVGAIIPWLQFYKHGIADPSFRCTDTVNHAVLLVGYGTEDGKQYWSLKNSWGEKWGESGYFRLIRGEGRCGMNTIATAPVAKAASNLLLV